MNAMDTQALLASTMQKIASRKDKEEDKKESEKKPPEKEIVKGMDGCKYAMKVAESLDYLLQYSEAWLGSPIERAVKVAGSLDIPNILPHSQSHGPNGKAINEKRDSMAVGEEPTANHSGVKSKEVPNMLDNTLGKKPGGSPEKPADPPLYNKTAYQKVLSKLASNKTADQVPNQLRTMTADESGKGQSGYDSGSSHGNGNRHLIESNESVMNCTKGDAKKAYNKEQMSQVFDEVHPEKDTALDRAFEHGVSGAKLAGVEDAKKLLSMAKKEVKEEKAEEEKHPGIHKEIEKKAGLSDLAGKALGGLAGSATKLHEAGKGAVNFVKQHPKELAGGAAGLAGLGAVGYGLDKATDAVEEKCTCEGKATCKACKEKVTKMAQVFRMLKEADQVPTNAPAGTTPDVTSQVTSQMEQGGEEDEIEKVKKLLLALQMMKQQQLQAQMPAVDQAAPGAGTVADSTAAMAGPTTGAV